MEHGLDTSDCCRKAQLRQGWAFEAKDNLTVQAGCSDCDLGSAYVDGADDLHVSSPSLCMTRTASRQASCRRLGFLDYLLLGSVKVIHLAVAVRTYREVGGDQNLEADVR